MDREPPLTPRVPGAWPPRGRRKPPDPPRRSRRWPWWLLAALLLLPLLLVVGGLAAAWHSLHTEAGTRWWLQFAAERVPGLTLGEARGPLLGAASAFTLDHAALQTGKSTLRVDSLRIDGLQLGRWQLRAPYVHVEARSLALRRLGIATEPSSEAGTPPQPPDDLRLPITARIDSVRVGRIDLPGVAVPIEGVSALVEAGATHRIDTLSLRWNGMLAEGSARIEAEAPLVLRASLALRSDPDAAPAEPSALPLPAWTRGLALQLVANGPLEHFDATATLSLEKQSLDAKAQITPFAPLPLSQLDAHFAQLDLAPLLAPFAPQAPSTALTGSAVLRLDPDAPLRVDLHASNALPGRWDQKRVPVRDLQVRASGQGADWQIESANALLAASAQTPAGRLSGSGRLEDGVGVVELLLDGVLPQQLDRRAPALRLSGPIRLKHMPVPAGSRAPDATPAPTPPKAPRAPTQPGPGALPAAPAFGQLEFDARISGSLLGDARARAPRPLRDTVQLELRGSATPTQLVLESLSARAGKARLDGEGRARRSGRVWTTEADLKLAAFDPTLWLPGEPRAAWRRARNVLNGSLALRARIPADAPNAAALLGRLQGTLRADLADSALAGQAVALALLAAADGAGLLSADASADAAGNKATLALRLGTPAGRRAARDDERLELQVDAPALARLAPLAELFGLGPLAGQARLDTRVEGGLGTVVFGGTAASLSTKGRLDAEALQAGGLQLETAEAEWNATLPAGATGAGADALAGALLQGRLRAAQVRVPGLVLPSLALDADGRLAEHHVRLRATLRQPEPAPGSEASATPPGAASAALALAADLDGAWRAGAAGAPSTWRARLAELSLRPLRPGTNGARNGNGNGTAADRNAGASSASNGGDGSASTAPATAPLLVARDVRLLLEHGAQSLALQLEPGRAEVLGAALRWSRLQWQRVGAAAPQLEVQAEVEPFVVAQLLQRLQPDFGWAGDLRLGARIDVRSDPVVTAKVEIARTGGDLQISEFGIVQSLGLSDARLELDVRSGAWRFTELIAGANLGRIEGVQTVRTAPTALWPAPGAPLDGRLSVQVENLAAWGAWVPAGWRLGGELNAQLRLAGSFGAPELIGEVHGRELALRNALEGVALSEGRLDARFEGASARLESLRFQAGDGELRASGTARLGAQPEARIDFTAENARVLGRVDRLVIASGKASLVLDAQAIAISGDLRIDRGLIDISRGDAPTLGDDVTVRRPGDTAEADAAAAAAGRTPRDIEMRIAIDLGPRLRLRGRGIDTRLTGELNLTTPNGRLAAHGEIRTDEGTYEAYGQDLAIEQGILTFVGALDNPRLNIEAVRANTDVRVGVRVTGSALRPRVQLFSDPELPATEKLALLVTGRSYDSLAGSETLLLQRAALALLAGDGSSGASAFDPARLLQLDELSVRQSDGAVRDTVVTLGKQLSDRVYIGYERGLQAAAGNWQLIYRIAQRFTVRAQSGEDPAVDLIWLFRWN